MLFVCLFLLVLLLPLIKRYQKSGIEIEMESAYDVLMFHIDKAMHLHQIMDLESQIDIFYETYVSKIPDKKLDPFYARLIAEATKRKRLVVNLENLN